MRSYDGEGLCWVPARISANITRSRGMIAGVIIKEIGYREVDRGFGLQTGRVARVFSCGEADDDRLLGHGETRTTERAEKVALAREGTFPIGGLRAAEESPAPSLVHAQADCTALQADSLTSGLEIERPFRHWADLRDDEQDSAERMKRERWCISREEGGEFGLGGFEGHRLMRGFARSTLSCNNILSAS